MNTTERRRFARNQPCGCVICICDSQERCQGCGSKHCGNHPFGGFPNPVYETEAVADIPCPRCEGEGEIHVGSSVPDDEGYDTCPLCNGLKKQPDNNAIEELQRKCWELEGNAQADGFVREQLEEQVEHVTQELAKAKKLLSQWPKNQGVCHCAKHWSRHSDDCPVGQLLGPRITDTKEQRLEKVNELIATIASCGRNFFKHQDRLAHADFLNNGKLYWIDEFTGRQVCLERGNWGHWANRINHGGGIRTFIQGLREYILRGQLLNEGYFTHWGYGNDIQVVTSKAKELGIIVDGNES